MSTDEGVWVRGPDARPLADEWGLHFRAAPDTVLDVLFDGWRVWSLVAESHPADRHGVRHAEWPAPMRRFLDGRAVVALRVHGHEDVSAEAEASFGSGEGRVKVADESGRRLAMTKWGRLSHPFDVADSGQVESYLDEVERVLSILSDECGVPAFISFGTLLGAVRQGKLIGHDVDVDLGYLSNFEHPADVQRENFRIERVLRDRGYPMVRQNGGFLALFIYYPDGTRRNLDVFTCFTIEDRLYQVHDIGTTGGRSTILPLRRIPVEGRHLPAPADPERLLEAAYGPGWRTPDPAFEFNTPRATMRRIGGWLGGLRTARDQWLNFYGDPSHLSWDPTLFAQWVAQRERPGQLVDVGCGNGRDSIYFASLGYDVLGLDYVARAVKSAQSVARQRGVALKFEHPNLYSLRETLTMGARIARRPGPRVFYARFLLHALEHDGRDNMWRLCEMALRAGGRCYVEFRTPRDRDRPKRFGGRIRRFPDVETIITEAERRGGRVVVREEGTGLAPFESENPHVCRLAFDWER